MEKEYTESELKRIRWEKEQQQRAALRYEREVRNASPTKSQYASVKRLFADFGIRNVKIPQFDTYWELEQWQRSELKRRLK